jgi:hypothetical protein
MPGHACISTTTLTADLGLLVFQVAGFSVRYRNGLSFATVKGAGHMVPQCKPDVGLELFRRFLRGAL